MIHCIPQRTMVRKIKLSAVINYVKLKWAIKHGFKMFVFKGSLSRKPFVSKKKGKQMIHFSRENANSFNIQIGENKEK